MTALDLCRLGVAAGLVRAAPLLTSTWRGVWAACWADCACSKLPTLPCRRAGQMGKSRWTALNDLPSLGAIVLLNGAHDSPAGRMTDPAICLKSS